MKLDKFDKMILNQIQRDADKTHAEIGELVGLSSSAVRRRLQRFKNTGLIECQIVIMDADTFGITVIVDISFENETPEIYTEFDQQIKSLDAVQQSYHVAGNTDYVLVVHGPSLQWYEEWSKDILMTNPNIQRYSSRVVWSRKKFSPGVTIQNA